MVSVMFVLLFFGTIIGWFVILGRFTDQSERARRGVREREERRRSLMTPEDRKREDLIRESRAAMRYHRDIATSDPRGSA